MRLSAKNSRAVYAAKCLVHALIAGVEPKAPDLHGQCVARGKGPWDPCSEGDACFDFGSTGSARFERTAECWDQGKSSRLAELHQWIGEQETASQNRPCEGCHRRCHSGSEGLWWVVPELKEGGMHLGERSMADGPD